MNDLELSPIVGTTITAEQARAASLAVCARAENVDEAKTLMAMLGLLGKV